MSSLVNWWNAQSDTGVLEHDILVDFDLGSHLVTFNINLNNCMCQEVTESFNISGTDYELYFWSMGPNPPQPTTDIYASQSTGGNTTFFMDGNYWETLLVKNGAATVHASSIYTSGDIYTRINRHLLADPAWGDSIAGPYELYLTIPGAYSIDLYLFLHRRPVTFGNGTTIPSGTTPIPCPLQPPGVQPYALKTWNLTAYQKSVSVIRKDSSTGPVLATGTTITNVVPLSPIPSLTLDKSSNRGDDITSEWQVFVLDSGGSGYIPATPLVDYSLAGLETLTSDTINITFNVNGMFKVFNNCSGTTSVSAGANTSSSVLNIEVTGTTPVVETLTFPTIQTIITPIAAYDNVVVTTNPLVGIENFQITVDATLDTTNASWTTQIGSLPVIITTLNEAGWKTEMSARANVKCVVKKITTTIVNGVPQTSTTVVSTQIGWGPHSFTLAAGTYEVGWELSASGGSQSSYTYSQILSIL